MTVPPPSSKVTIRGLVSRPALNGQVATVLGPTHSKEAEEGYAKGRVPVRLEGESGPPLLLKPEALEAVVASASTADADALCETGWALFESGQPAEAIATYKEAVRLAPASFTAHFQLGQIYEATSAAEPAARHYLSAMQLVAPESATPDYAPWTHAFVRSANLLIGLPSASKPEWWSACGLKQRCGVVLNNPQGYLCDQPLVSPAWQVMAHAFLIEEDRTEAANCYNKAAEYEMDKDRCRALMERAGELA